MAKDKVRALMQLVIGQILSCFFSVFVGTWNVHGSLPASSLKNWLQGTLKTDEGAPFDPDFYIIG